MAMALAPPSSQWPFLERAAGSRHASPPPSRGGSLSVDNLTPAFPIGALRQRSVSPTPLSPAPSRAAPQAMAVPARVSSAEVPVPLPVASVDAKGDARSLRYIGGDRFRDGTPDARQVMSPTGASTTAPVEVLRDGNLLLHDMQVFYNGNKAPLSSLIQDVVTQQFLQIKESMKQEVDRCTQMVQTQTTKSEDLIRGLEAERAVRHTMLVGMRNDFDRQQAQISDIVQSRFVASAAHDQSFRERDEEMSVIVQNIRQDIEALRAQSRSTFAGNIAYSEHQQRVEKAYADLRRDFESFTRDSEQFQSVQTKMVKGVEDLQHRFERATARTKKEFEAERAESSQHLTDLMQQLSKQREHQQQVERVVLEFRKELQAALAAVAQQKEQLEEQHKSSKAMSSSLSTSEASIMELRRQLEDPARNKRLEECIQHLEQEHQVASHHIADVVRVVNDESAARIELMQSLDAYRAAYLQTSSEHRAELAVVQDRVAALEIQKVQDTGLRERTMEQLERNLQELQSVTALERQKAMKQEEGTAQSLRKEIEAVAENCGTVRSFVDHYMQDLTRMVQEESDARLQFADVFNEYRCSCESALAEAGQRMDRLETAVQDSSEFLGTRTELQAQLEVAMEKIYRLENISEDIDARHSRSSEMLQRSLMELRELILEGERAARGSEAAVLSEAAALRGSLESVSTCLATVVGDVEVERVRRMREASTLQTEMQAMRSKLQHLEVATVESENTVTELRRIAEPGLQSVSEDLNAVAADMDKQRALVARDTSKLQTGMDAMREKLATLESAANEDRGWRQQAVQDLEVILGDLKHITPAVACSRSMPTLATALRLSKS